ncbi:MAG: Cytochrome oxidase, cbb3-type, subunit [Moraxellaceae bacterium]|jgi:cytochrome c5|nr:Cytochrome oxidase, cbb3-type, subunit [Moraxellaceae bacterium]MDF3030977.1 Cytochrome oxidase, cbb3-type, subunit [Moraxellaceae bacterium]
MQKILLAAVIAGLFAGVSTAQAAGIQDKYNKACAACHNSGAAGAPKKGDKAAWAPRLKKGDAALLNSVKNGFKAMPPKGLCTDCTDADFKALIKFMSN